VTFDTPVSRIDSREIPFARPDLSPLMNLPRTDRGKVTSKTILVSKTHEDCGFSEN